MTSHFHSSILLCCLKSIPNFTLYFASSNIRTLSPRILKSIRVPNFDQTVGWRSSGHMAYHKSNTGPKSIEVCTSVYYCWLGFPTIQNYRVGHDFSFWRVWRVYFQLWRGLYYHDYCHSYQIVLLQSHTLIIFGLWVLSDPVRYIWLIHVIFPFIPSGFWTSFLDIGRVIPGVGPIDLCFLMSAMRTHHVKHINPCL